MNEENKWRLIEEQRRRERQAMEEIGSGLLEAIEKAKSAQGSSTAGLPYETLEGIGLMPRSEDAVQEDMVPEQELQSNSGASSPPSTTTKNEPLELTIARLELAAGIDPASRGDMSLEERIGALEKLNED